MEFESILLTYENENRVAYQSLAEFLRLLGIFVCEKVKYPKDSWEDVTQDREKYGYEYKVLEYSIKNNHIWLKEGLEDIFGESYFYKWYEQLFTEVYKKYDLLRASMTLQYYRLEHIKVQQAGDCFADAAKGIARLIAENPEYVENEYVRYAQLYCKQKANLAYYMCNLPVAYYVNDLAEEGLRLAKAFPDFANTWVLLGLIYEISENYVKDAIDAFDRAIEMIGNKPYVSSIYYWKGRRCEEYDTLKKLQYEAYQRAYDIRPKYRNIYKIARRYLVQKDWETALCYYKECLGDIEKKGHYLDPLEQEYYFKVKVHISYIHLQLNDYYNAIINAKEVIEFRNQIMRRTGQHVLFYAHMYGEDADAYIEITLSRFQLHQTWRYLAIAYQESGMKEQADTYWELYNRS